jgi:hydrogenase/urease accessory protein HupE
MLVMKRVVIATILGVIFGFVCWGSTLSQGPQPWFFALQVIISRTLIGFAIGISTLKIPWWLHGIIFGLLFSLPMGLNGFYVPGKEIFIFLSTVIMGIIYGFLIELFTTIVFKTPTA